jgi:EAL domain-containing protein (putative c-di-GMP-specific phosphodiesterase class I)
MYQAKNRGRARFELFDDELREQAVKRFNLERNLFGAADRGELLQFYQPIVWTDTGVVFAFESLLRWNHPIYGLLSAAEFIDIAENSQIVLGIGEWTMMQACRQTAAWRERFGWSPRIGVNLSGREAVVNNIATRVTHLAESSGADLHDITIELTETVFLESVQSFLQGLHELRRLGIRVSLDDFGTGFSSLSYLRRFPVNSLKIDASFVAGLGQNTDDASIVEAVISLGHSLRLNVIAEGVERPQQLAQLRALGCDMAQGFLISPPLSEPDATAFLTDHLPSSAAVEGTVPGEDVANTGLG